MKKLFYLAIAIPLLTMAACLMIVDVSISASIDMEIPSMSIGIPSIGWTTNFYAETLKTNTSRDTIGQLVDVQELRISYILTNKSSETCKISIAVSTNHSFETNDQVVVYLDQSYLHDSNQTAFIVDNVSIPPYSFVSNTYVANSVNPVLIRALIYSYQYSIILSTGVTGSSIGVVDFSLGLDSYVSLKFSKEVSDMPNIISLIQ